ncbi:hypothetical protein tb265_16010 [Gemmatimonadetes bacterium T265]|nr:hypothetical protein tb265_16010 [Gemmatimonadetes bacterium T265]
MDRPPGAWVPQVATARALAGVASLCMAVAEVRPLRRLGLPDVLRLPYALPDFAVTPGVAATALGVWVACGVCFALGWHARAAGVGLALVMSGVLLLDEQTYSNHLYLAVLVVVLLVWADATARRNPAVPVLLLRTQVSLVYGWTAVAKLNATFLSGAAVFAALPWAVRTPLLARGLAAPVAMLLAVTTVVLELWIAVSLWRPGARRDACVAGVALHAGMVALLAVGGRVALTGFALLMFAGYVVFFDEVPAVRGRVGAPGRA